MTVTAPRPKGIIILILFQCSNDILSTHVSVDQTMFVKINIVMLHSYRQREDGVCRHMSNTCKTRVRYTQVQLCDCSVLDKAHDIIGTQLSSYQENIIERFIQMKYKNTEDYYIAVGTASILSGPLSGYGIRRRQSSLSVVAIFLQESTRTESSMRIVIIVNIS